LARPLGRQARRDVSAWLRRISFGVDDQESTVERLLESEEAPQTPVVDVNHRPFLVCKDGSEIGTEVDRNALRKRRMPVHADAQLTTHTAVRPVSSDQIL